ncbi:MAG TPA: SpaA isopeptide-forming pilin-related protein [Mycobacterium sp.]|nr:SpaA isopeptide-forming pilin-related protein [Mycobacterium sp.]
MATRILGPTDSRRRRRFLLGPVLLVTVVALLFTVGAQAVHAEGIFELDKNAVNSVATPGNDWDQVFANTANNCSALGAIACTFVHDPEGTTIFQTGGSKDINDIPQWRYTGGSVPDKDELTNAYAAMYVGPAGSGLAGHQIIYFGADRFANNGDSVIGFWFFKNDISLNADGTFSGVHSVGDILLISDFSGGGGTTTIGAFEWVGSGGSDGALNSLGTSLADCVPGPAAGDAGCATVNSSPTPSPWPYTPKSGPANIFPSGSFFEGGVDLTQLEVEGCFSSFLAETRSSTSLSAQLKDFIGGSFQPCRAKISIAPTATNEVGTNHTFTITAEKLDPTTGFVFGPAPNVLVTTTKTDSNGATSSYVPAGQNTCTTNASGTCTVTITSPTAGQTTVNASASIPLQGGTNVSVSTNGTGGNSGPAVKTWVDANITIAPNDTNEVGAPHTFTVTVQQNAGGGAGFVAATVGNVDVSLTNSNGSAAVIDGANSTCDDNQPSGDNLNDSGQCTLTFTSASAGTVTGNASVALTVGGVALTRSTSGNAGPGGSGAATKVFVDAKISVSPLTDTNGITELHTITATVQQDAGNGSGFVNAPDGTLVTFTLLNNTANAVFVPAGVNTCNTTGGSCSIQITSATAGSVDVNASTTFSVGGVSLTRATGTGGNNSANANKVFVAGTLRWLKNDQDGNPLGGATFRVCRIANFDSSTNTFVPISPTVCINDAGTPPDVIDNGPFDADPDAGQLQINNLILGRYTIVETIPPAGYTPDPDTETVELTVANPSNAGNPPVFVNVRLFKLIVITCNQSTNQLVVSVVTLNSVTKDTIGVVPASLSGTTPAITQANICDIGGASYDNLSAGTYVPSVVIPKP